MNITLINQAFHPDVVATGQYLADLARKLADDGHHVTVVSSRRAYDNPRKLFASREQWQGIDIQRVWATGFGKGAKWRRALDFASFAVSCALQLLRTPRPDVVVALTSPPLVSLLAAWFARLKRCRFVYWVMDLNPDEAIVAGWLRENSIPGRILDWASRYSLRHAAAVIVLDSYMHKRILAKGIAPGNLHVLPPWSHDTEVRFDSAGRDRFRAQHGLTGKLVVMYSGNHSPCHPLQTLLRAANEMRTDQQVQFCFVGGGSEFAKVKTFAAEHALSNVTCLPYQPLSELSASLSAADLHVVVMGNAFVGTIHPCKIYNILGVACPFLYIGPDQSHIQDVLVRLRAPQGCASARHDDVPGVVKHIESIKTAVPRLSGPVFDVVSRSFQSDALLPALVQIITGNELPVAPKPAGALLAPKAVAPKP